jgi:hypothetical protein
LDGGNLHPDNLWETMSEEQRRWQSPCLPVARHHYERTHAMMEQADYVLTACHFVAQSFLGAWTACQRQAMPGPAGKPPVPAAAEFLPVSTSEFPQPPPEFTVLLS